MTSTVSQMKREEGLLNLLCLVAAGGLFAFIAYNLFAAGSIISTDGLFFTVVPFVLALCFLAVPAMQIAAKRFGKTDEKVVIPSKHVSSVSTMPRPTYAPALKDARGRELPPDVSRMVAQMKAPPAKEN
jgi:hypothetical protein